ncbi:ABC transporter ATP-binding protein [Planosporangium thailandense]|uniref:ABC transporter ATP-binding protein n=1 Tax=Planosporangium thailandense TaxID=765197 RepID=A0ABX0XVW7_9ACTN|nr:ABC transporter ATP-binding protein [Planosporangium thailandense]NJC70184.1 ABC transporter ATP-binding protein [Planosporangium thailandense]
MKALPVSDPGTPDHRSATRYLLWLARTQAATLAGGIAFGIIWMAAPALAPATIGRAVDALAAHDRHGLARWSVVLLGLGVVQTVAGMLRHRFAVTNWLSAAYRTVQVTTRQATRLGATLPKRVAAGEVVSIGTADISHLGHGLDVLARGSGAVVAVVVVTVILLSASPRLGLVVLVGVPLLMATVGLLLRPIHRRQHAYRELTGALTGRAADIVAGLRVLRGVGGEAAFAARYRAQSQELRAAGVRVARVESFLEAAQVLLPGVFVALVTWIGARFALAGEITPGDLVTFYGYAVFLSFPIRTLVEAAQKLTRAHVAARRVVRVLALRPEVADPPTPATPPAATGDLVEPVSGLVVRSGEFTALAAADPADALAIADRLGRYDPASAARLDGVPLRDLAVAAVRERILVADNDARLFRGRLCDELATGAAVDPADLEAALHTAAAHDIVEALPDGLDTELTQGGREFSGGQQQRLRLARALLADPPVLVFVEPTSAVDAHTEARIGDRLVTARAGRTTLACTTSPLLLDRADRVVFVADGRVVAEGTHAELRRTQPRYAATVTRGES